MRLDERSIRRIVKNEVARVLQEAYGEDPIMSMSPGEIIEMSLNDLSRVPPRDIEDAAERVMGDRETFEMIRDNIENFIDAAEGDQAAILDAAEALPPIILRYIRAHELVYMFEKAIEEQDVDAYDEYLTQIRDAAEELRELHQSFYA